MRMEKVYKPSQYHRQAYTVVMLQLSILLLLTVVSLWRYENDIVLAVLGGGISIILPTVLFAVIVFYNIYRRNARQHLSWFYIGEISKVLLSMVLVFMMTICWQMKPIPFFVSFLITYLSIFFIPLIQHCRYIAL
jgi:ATP synthase protein I